MDPSDPSGQELKGLAAKMALPEQEVDHLDVQFRHYDFDGSGALDLEEVRSILADIGLSPQNREEKFEALGPRFWDLGDHEQRFSGQSKRRFGDLLFVPELAI
ncbi:unnamed protein product [Cladocopium goreaui]|uniref:Calmodulin n=1 Tax=Cladocopium goreaui TaxID=2562237 RepID=A0A9P1FZM5_9DINO|nr:unnamed protein product [Cladocopium goreaui]